MTNALTRDAAYTALEALGARAGSGSASVIETAQTLFLYAETLTGKEAAIDAYKRYAIANNKSSVYAKQIDLGNEKSLKAQVSKFNVFIKLGGIERTQRHDFIERVCALWDSIEGKKGGQYESLLKCARAQIEQGRLMTDEEILETIEGEPKVKTRVSGLEALLANAEKHAEKWAQDAIPGGQFQLILEALRHVTQEAKKDATDAMLGG